MSKRQRNRQRHNIWELKRKNCPNCGAPDGAHFVRGFFTCGEYSAARVAMNMQHTVVMMKGTTVGKTTEILPEFLDYARKIAT